MRVDRRIQSGKSYMTTTSKRTFGHPSLLWLLLFSWFLPNVALRISGRTPPVAAFDVLCGIVILVFILKQTGRKRSPLAHDRPILLLSCCNLLLMLCSLWINGADFLRAVSAVKVFSLGIFTYFLTISSIRSRQDLRLSLYAVVSFGTAVSIYLAYLLGIQPSLQVFKSQIQFLGLLGLSNYTAALLVIIFPVSMGISLTLRGYRRYLFLLTSFLIGCGILIISSKGAILALLGSLIVTAPFSYKKLLRPSFIVCGGALVLGVVALVPNTQTEAFRSDITGLFLYSDVVRTDLLRIAWNTFLDNPVLGVGPYNFIFVLNRETAYGQYFPHNFVLQSLVDQGLVGSLPFFAMILVVVGRSYRVGVRLSETYREDYICMGLFISTVAAILHSLVEPTFHGQAYSSLFWLLAGLVTAMNRVTQSDTMVRSD